MSKLDIVSCGHEEGIQWEWGNVLLAIFGRTQILRKPSSPQTINSHQSNTRKLTNEVFLAG